MLLRNYLFHRVSDEADNHWPPMKPALFDTIIRHLCRKHPIVLLEDLLADPQSFKNSSNTFVTITFDDGYKDNIEIAAPILKKYNCPASFYIVTNSIDANIPTWTYIVDFIIANTRKEKIVFSFDNLSQEFREIELLPGKKSNLSSRILKPWLKSLPNKNRKMMIEQLISQCEDVTLPAGQMMSWENIRELKGDGFYIGSHSHTHAMLASIESEHEIRDELLFSANRIKEETSVFPLTIAYPVGSYDDRVIRIAKDCGYSWGVAVNQCFFNYDPQNLFSISRVELYNEPEWKAKLRIAGIINRVKKLW